MKITVELTKEEQENFQKELKIFIRRCAGKKASYTKYHDNEGHEYWNACRSAALKIKDALQKENPEQN